MVTLSLEVTPVYAGDGWLNMPETKESYAYRVMHRMAWRNRPQATENTELAKSLLYARSRISSYRFVTH
jgi:hypothetical protein